MRRPPGRRRPPGCRTTDVTSSGAVGRRCSRSPPRPRRRRRRRTRGPTAAPRTTDAAALAAQAREREIHERFARGVAAEERGDWTAAAAEFRASIALDPPEPKGSTARYDLALAEIHLGRDDVAARRCSKRRSIAIPVSRRRPRTSSRSNCGAAISPRRAPPPTAFVAIAPDAVLARYVRGLAALRAGDLAAARADFRALHRRRPGVRRRALRPRAGRAARPAATTPRAPSSTARSRCRRRTRAPASRWAPC